MSLYRVEMRVYATAYIKAKSAKEAQRIARGLKDKFLEVEDAGGDIDISGADYYDPDLPDISFSPAMTVAGASGNVELVEA